MSNQFRSGIVSNFGQGNIDALERKFSDDSAGSEVPARAFTMVHVNTNTEVNVTHENRIACAQSIIR